MFQISVVILTTRKPIEGVTKDEIKKPAIFKLYDFSKTGTDSMDRRLVQNWYNYRAGVIDKLCCHQKNGYGACYFSRRLIQEGDGGEVEHPKNLGGCHVTWPCFKLFWAKPCAGSLIDLKELITSI